MRNFLVAVLVLAVAAVTGVAFYVGQHNAGVAAFAPALHLPGFQPSVTRLPSKKFGNWTLACLLDLQQAKHCNLVFQAVDNSRKHLLLRLVVARTATGQVAMIISTPPDAAMASGVKLNPGSAPPVMIPFIRCRPHTCEASLPLTDSLANALATADTTRVTFSATGGKPISYQLPSQGFKEGFAAWQKEKSAQSSTVADTPPVTIPANGQQAN
jgi:invasion protein IalB